MSYTRKELEIHSFLSELMEKYGEYEFVQFERAAQIGGIQYLEFIIEAILHKKVLNIYYHPFYEDKPYFIDVHPYILKEYKYRWYLLGLNEFKGQIRTYALDRMRDVKISEEITYIEKEFNAGDYFRNSLGIISPQGQPPLIKIAVQKTQAQYLISQPWHQSQNLLEETADEVIFSYRIHPTYEFRSLLLSLGADAIVLEPKQLRNDILRELHDLTERYQPMKE
jgi:predicted DNA-binding transcriptional regulator YafY